MINNKVIYLKSLVKNFKSKQEGLPKEIIKELKALGIDLIKPKVKLKEEDDFTAGRDFILNHTEEFLQYAVDYSLDEKIGDIIKEKKFEEKIWQLHVYVRIFFTPMPQKINKRGGCLIEYNTNATVVAHSW